MENEGKTVKVKDHIKEILYIEMIHQQMETFIDIDNLLKSNITDSKVIKNNQS